MTKPRKLHQLIGTIKYCFPGKVTAKQWKNQPFYCLEITQQTLFTKTQQTIYAFPNLVSKEIWTTLEQEHYRNKSYLFSCEKRVRGWRLKDWTEIKST